MDAPERIFCKEGHDAWNAWGHWYLHNRGGGVQYVRADIPAARIAELEAENARLRWAGERLADLWDKSDFDRVGPAVRQMRTALDKDRTP